jgi:hypothetical protein
MNNTNIFIIGIILGGLVVIVFLRNSYLRRKISKLTDKLDKLSKSYSKISNQVERRNSNLKRAVYVTTGWHYQKEKLDNPTGYKQWDVTLTLEETGEKTSDKTKFKVVDFSADLLDNVDTLEHCQDWFNRRKNGGWLDPSDVKWIETKSKQEQRGEFLNDILNEDDGE